jgi:hypothetical protein
VGAADSYVGGRVGSHAGGGTAGYVVRQYTALGMSAVVPIAAFALGRHHARGAPAPGSILLA